MTAKVRWEILNSHLAEQVVTRHMFLAEGVLQETFGNIPRDPERLVLDKEPQQSFSVLATHDIHGMSNTL